MNKRLQSILIKSIKIMLFSILLIINFPFIQDSSFKFGMFLSKCEGDCLGIKFFSDVLGFIGSLIIILIINYILNKKLDIFLKDKKYLTKISVFYSIYLFFILHYFYFENISNSNLYYILNNPIGKEGIIEFILSIIFSLIGVIFISILFQLYFKFIKLGK